ncbi:organic hydroperoxide resistance protein [Echinicola sp. CAU 1574]|uniref:Organic hydroperoxide resistance protein n=1 Tax=Echinicola arenosa TaxID=2774144 RepID=A0ABR9AJ87_9BACT|nr:organic hydroperoxide resistance protein [Echinicola arenosa]MBD8488863.1 organic hydroperoxide resistance protein [Echinicola arenosa]
MKLMYEAEAKAQGGRNGHVVSSDNVLDFEVRVPKSMGGEGGAYTNPEQLFAAGYAACFDSALNFIAQKQKVKVENTEVNAKVGIGQLSNGGFGLAVELLVKIPNLDKEQAQALMEAAHKACPYSNAIRGNVDVKLELA